VGYISTIAGKIRELDVVVDSRLPFPFPVCEGVVINTVTPSCWVGTFPTLLHVPAGQVDYDRLCRDIQRQVQNDKQ
jgi:hypothetical protein